MKRRLAFLIAALGLPACSSGDTPAVTSGSASTATMSTACIPGASIACGCSDGRTGSQLCVPGGEGYATCMCAGLPPTSSSTAGGGGTGGQGGGAGAMGGSGSSATTGGNGGGGSPPAGHPRWGLEIGTTNAIVQDVASDAHGNAIIAGNFTGSIDFGAGPTTCMNTCGFVAKVGPPGNVVWGVPFSGNVEDTVIAVGANDEVLVAGGFGSTVDFGSGPVGTNNPGVYIARYTASGTPKPTLHFASQPGASTSATGLAVDSTGKIVLLGESSANIDFGLGAVAGGTFVVAFDSAGVPQWSKSFANAHQPAQTNGASASTLALNSLGDIVLVGTYQDGANLGCDAMSGSGNYLAKLTPTGGCHFSHPFGSPSPNSTSVFVTVDPASDDILLAGWNGGTATFDTLTLTSAGQSDAFLVRLDSAGSLMWGHGWGDATYQGADGVTVDPTSGNVSITGLNQGSTNFGNGVVPGPGQILVATFTSNGDLVRATNYGDSNGGAGYGIAYAPNGDLFVGGFFGGTMILGSSLIQAPGQSDGFLIDVAGP